MRSLHVDLGRQWRGGQRQCLLLCARLHAQGEEVVLVCRPGSPLYERARAEGVPTLALAAAGELDPAAAWRLRAVLTRALPDLAAAHEAHGLGLLALATVGLRTALVYHRRVDVPLGMQAFSRWKFRRVERFVCVSERIAEIVRAGGIAAARTAVVHSGTRGVFAPPEARAEVRAELGVAEGTALIGVVGGLIPHKGHGVLLEALAQVAAPARTVFAGDGPLRAELERRARGLGVAFLGERADIERLFAAFDLYVHPSLTEGLGSSIADAFSAGVPVVASRTGGIPEIVRDGETGRLVPPGDARALAEAIAAALAEPERSAAMAERARAFFLAELTDEAMARKTLAVYRAICAARAVSSPILRG